ncbi:MULTISPECIES: hypothetical protein [unclassified Paraburkholderia]|uniref:hypothetical protein n=1 Tax=unclassified Paraburkholderia TaxID=2615204 RepID=UPI001613A54C|nr:MULTISPECIES: hypothetical protein [unclassified Paraburkholderia]MBB5446467.1 hypothetical protein [Paraburkholderia sp. WSM4177]MBB5486951.1 hypothetical protein [Paraburkholderia sp. WSM4180]
MANEATRSTVAEQLDVKEIVFAMDTATGLFAYANTSFSDLAAPFEAIQDSAGRGTDSLTSRLASLGRNLCDSLENDFSNYQDDYQARTECYSAALMGVPCPLPRQRKAN